LCCNQNVAKILLNYVATAIYSCRKPRRSKLLRLAAAAYTFYGYGGLRLANSTAAYGG